MCRGGQKVGSDSNPLLFGPAFGGDVPPPAFPPPAVGLTEGAALAAAAPVEAVAEADVAGADVACAVTDVPGAMAPAVPVLVGAEDGSAVAPAAPVAVARGGELLGAGRAASPASPADSDAEVTAHPTTASTTITETAATQITHDERRLCPAVGVSAPAPVSVPAVSPTAVGYPPLRPADGASPQPAESGVDARGAGAASKAAATGAICMVMRLASAPNTGAGAFTAGGATTPR